MNTITKYTKNGVDYCFTDTNLRHLVDKNYGLLYKQINDNVVSLKYHVANRLSLLSNTYATKTYVNEQVEGLATTEYVDNIVGQIASQLDEINGEEI